MQKNLTTKKENYSIYLLTDLSTPSKTVWKTNLISILDLMLVWCIAWFNLQFSITNTLIQCLHIMYWKHFFLCLGIKFHCSLGDLPSRSSCFSYTAEALLCARHCLINVTIFANISQVFPNNKMLPKSTTEAFNFFNKLFY